MNEKNQTSRKRISKILSSVFTVIFSALFLFSGYQIISYLLEGKEESDLNREMIQEAVISLQEKPIYIEDVFPHETTVTQDAKPKKSIIYYPDISVDMKKLKLEYPGIVGWLYQPGTPINYPVMQAEDNDYYIHRLPNGKENSAGSIFMDFRSQSDLSGEICILYGHNMKNNSMFGTILEYRDASYYANHPYLFYFADGVKYRLEVFAGVHTTADSYIYSIPKNADDSRAFLSKIRSSAVFNSEVSVLENDQIFVLSTCSGSTSSSRRFVVCAKLVPIES